MSEPARPPDQRLADRLRFYEGASQFADEVEALEAALAVRERQLTSLREAARAVLRRPVMNPDLEAWDRLRELAAGDQQDSQ